MGDWMSQSQGMPHFPWSVQMFVYTRGDTERYTSKLSWSLKARPAKLEKAGGVGSTGDWGVSPKTLGIG